MQIGLCIFSTHYAMRPDDLARAAEDRGFESLWLPEHSHIPANKLGPTGTPLPEEYWHTYDPFVALTAAAMVTTKLKLGTGVCLVIQRDPIHTAKEVASLDVLSGGRFLFGIGAGWNAQEMGDHGTAYKSRFRLMRERIEAMKVIWTKDEPAFHGEFVNFDKMLAWPKPVQKPWPPILLGGNGPKALEAVAQYCDGWFPLGFFGTDFGKELATLRENVARAGRKMSDISISVFGAKADPAALESMEKQGIQRCILRLPSAGRDELLPLLDRYSGLVARV